MMVNITQEDIDRGVQGMSHACAIARGLQRVDVFNKADLQTIWVNGSRLFRVGNDLYMLPKKAQSFIRQFDADKTKAKPFSFQLRKAKEQNPMISRLPSFYQSNWTMAPAFSTYI